jgi:hypothetical protein
MSRSSNYRLKEDYHLSTGKWGSDTKLIPAGSYVRPLELCYVPQHVLDDPRWPFVDTKKEVYCYVNRLGIVPIPKDIIRGE